MIRIQTLSILFAIAALVPAVAAADKVEPKYDWGVAYYLSYDNNLGPAMPVVLKAIRAGITSENVVAGVQVDLPGPGGMQRAAITATGSKIDKIKSDDSADEDQAIAYLDWFVTNYPCRHYAFIFLDHGGDLDEMCLDLEPDTEGKFYMSGRVFGEKLRKFKPAMPVGHLDLVFFQQCGRGSLENLYSFRGIADYVMLSPLPVGTPNTYYTPLGQWLAKSPDASGKAVAEKIATEDRDFTVYTCVKSKLIDELPEKLNAALKPLLEKTNLKIPTRTNVAYTNADTHESTLDAEAYLKQLAKVNASAESMAEFQKWVDEELIVKRWFQKDHADLEKSLCGLALFVPVKPEEAMKYKALDLYKKSAIGELWAKLFPAAGVK
jgi:hypothetical protein